MENLNLNFEIRNIITKASYTGKTDDIKAWLNSLPNNNDNSINI